MRLKKLFPRSACAFGGEVGRIQQLPAAGLVRLSLLLVIPAIASILSAGPLQKGKPAAATPPAAVPAPAAVPPPAVPASVDAPPAAAPAAPVVPPAAPPAAGAGAPSGTVSIIGRISDGATVITGVSDTKSATIEIQDVGSGSLLAMQGGSSFSVTSDKTTGQFTAALAQPLYGGEDIRFLIVNSGSSPTIATINGDTTKTDLIVPSLGDGIVRANFAFGTVLSVDNNFQLYSTPSTSASSTSSSSSNSSSSQATLFLDFTVEKNWVWAGVSATATPPPSNTAGAEPTYHIEKHLAFMTYFETRLTSVPVSVCPASTATTPTPTPTSSIAFRPAASTTTSTSNTTGCGTGSSSTDTLSSFLNSAKSAELQGGAYLPILTKVWSYQNAPNALFIAPLMRVGFIAPTGSTTSGSTTVQPVNNANFYNFYGFGGRIGHFKLSSAHNTGPELLSWIDVTAGRFSNLETLEQMSTGTAAVRRWRIAVEGTLKIPSTPFLIGVSANIGQNLTGPPTLQAAKDDLRFFIGARFDAGKILAKLPAF